MRTDFLPKLGSARFHAPSDETDARPMLPPLVLALAPAARDLDLDLGLEMDDALSKDDVPEGAGPALGGGDVGRSGEAPVKVTEVGVVPRNSVEDEALDMVIPRA